MKPLPWKYCPAWNLRIYTKNDLGDCTRISNSYCLKTPVLGNCRVLRYGNSIVTTGRPQCQDFSFDQSFQTNRPQISYPNILNDKLPIDNQKRSINMKSGILGGSLFFSVAGNFYSFGSVSNLKMLQEKWSKTSQEVSLILNSLVFSNQLKHVCQIGSREATH